jgi:hypothetical protein
MHWAALMDILAWLAQGYGTDGREEMAWRFGARRYIREYLSRMI